MKPPREITKNQYRGINAHLHSHWQARGGWDTFHFNHIPDLMRLINNQLPAGYVADLIQSLQIRRADTLVARPESDVMIYDTDLARAAQPALRLQAASQAMRIPELMEVEPEVTEFNAIGIFERRSPDLAPGEPVVWIELLSPSNKPGGQDAVVYRRKRLNLLRSQIVFVEIDYLHETPSTFDYLPRYSTSRRKPQPEANAHPYLIVVLDPHPVVDDGVAYPYSFDVDSPLPVVDIPLSGDDVLRFDFGEPYEKTLTETGYAKRSVDYAEPPLNFERYSPDDQARILCRMIAVIQAAQAGVDLEANAPLPVESLPLDEARARYQSLVGPT